MMQQEGKVLKGRQNPNVRWNLNILYVLSPFQGFDIVYDIAPGVDTPVYVLSHLRCFSIGRLWREDVSHAEGFLFPCCKKSRSLLWNLAFLAVESRFLCCGKSLSLLKEDAFPAVGFLFIAVRGKAPNQRSTIVKVRKTTDGGVTPGNDAIGMKSPERTTEP